MEESTSPCKEENGSSENLESIDSEVLQMKMSFVDTLTRRILTLANKKSAGSSVLKEEHILSSIKEFEKEKSNNPRFYRIPVEGDGACLCELIFFENQADKNFKFTFLFFTTLRLIFF